MSDRDKLATLLRARGVIYPENAAAVAVDGGWRPPAREITTAAEVDALPVGSIVTIDGIAVQRTGRDWQSMNAADLRIASAALMQIHGPITLVHIPTEHCPHDSRSGADGRWRCDQCGADCGPDTYLTPTEETHRG